MVEPSAFSVGEVAESVADVAFSAMVMAFADAGKVASADVLNTFCALHVIAGALAVLVAFSLFARACWG